MRNRKIFLAIILIVIASIVVYSFISRDNSQNSTLQNKLRTENFTKAYENCINQFSLDLCKMFISEERARLYSICAKAEISKTELDTTVYPENKIAVIRWFDDKIQQTITLYLPYEPETEFAGCSAPVKSTLKHIQESQIP